MLSWNAQEPIDFNQALANPLYQVPLSLADTYRSSSIKSGERMKRGSSSKILIKSVKCKTPRNITNFFSNNENKTRLITLTFDYIKQYPLECLNILKCDSVVFSGDNYCEIVTPSNCETFDELKSDQE